jgi:hypothetical protein
MRGSLSRKGLLGLLPILWKRIGAVVWGYWSVGLRRLRRCGRSVFASPLCDGNGRSNVHGMKQGGSEFLWQADAAVGGGFSGFRDQASVHANAIGSDSHPEWHGGRHIDHSSRHPVGRLGISIGHIAEFVFNPSVAVRVFVLDLFHNRVTAGSGAVAFLAGGHVTPTDLTPTTLELRDLVGQADPHGNPARSAVIMPGIHDTLRLDGFP